MCIRDSSTRSIWDGCAKPGPRPAGACGNWPNRPSASSSTSTPLWLRCIRRRKGRRAPTSTASASPPLLRGHTRRGPLRCPAPRWNVKASSRAWTLHLAGLSRAPAQHHGTIVWVIRSRGGGSALKPCFSRKTTLVGSVRPQWSGVSRRRPSPIDGVQSRLHTHLSQQDLEMETERAAREGGPFFVFAGRRRGAAVGRSVPGEVCVAQALDHFDVGVSQSHCRLPQSLDEGGRFALRSFHNHALLAALNEGGDDLLVEVGALPHWHRLRNEGEASTASHR